MTGLGHVCTTPLVIPPKPPESHPKGIGGRYFTATAQSGSCFFSVVMIANIAAFGQVVLFGSKLLCSTCLCTTKLCSTNGILHWTIPHRNRPSCGLLRLRHPGRIPCDRWTGSSLRQQPHLLHLIDIPSGNPCIGNGAGSRHPLWRPRLLLSLPSALPQGAYPGTSASPPWSGSARLGQVSDGSIFAGKTFCFACFLGRVGISVRASQHPDLLGRLGCARLKRSL